MLKRKEGCGCENELNREVKKQILDKNDDQMSES